MKSAKEFLWQDILTPGDTEPYGRIPEEKIYEAMIAFTKRHVMAALKSSHYHNQLPEEDMEFSLDAYPLTNIV